MALKLNYSEIGLYARKSSSLYELSMALLTTIENAGEILYIEINRTDNRIRSPRLAASSR
jgi:hypothetical protein